MSASGARPYHHATHDDATLLHSDGGSCLQLDSDFSAAAFEKSSITQSHRLPKTYVAEMSAIKTDVIVRQRMHTLSVACRML